MARHYVNNKDFLAALIAYRDIRKAAEDSGKRQPIIPNYIGTCIKEIATRWTSKPQYANYPFREEMISDAIENCFMYLHNFNPDKSQNPFAYFTQVIKFACWRRIEREKEELYVKLKSAQKSPMNSDFYHQQDLDAADYDLSVGFDNTYAQDFIEHFEKQLSEKKAARKLKQTQSAELKEKVND